MGMAYTLAQLQELEAAIASGLLTVRYEGPPAREQTYQSLAAMRALRSEMIRELGGAPPAFRRVSFSKGFDLPRGGSNGSSGSDGTPFNE